MYRAIAAGAVEPWQLLLLLDELPKLLTLDYEIIDGLKGACRQLIPQLLGQYRWNSDWRNYKHFGQLLAMIQ